MKHFFSWAIDAQGSFTSQVEASKGFVTPCVSSPSFSPLYGYNAPVTCLILPLFTALVWIIPGASRLLPQR